jgi:hypothetical protein
MPEPKETEPVRGKVARVVGREASLTIAMFRHVLRLPRGARLRFRTEKTPFELAAQRDTARRRPLSAVGRPHFHAVFTLFAWCNTRNILSNVFPLEIVASEWGSRRREALISRAAHSIVALEA